VHPDSTNKSQGGRIYQTDGITPCLTSNGGGLGAKTGLYFINKPRFDKYKPSNLVETLKVGGDTPLVRVKNGTKKGYDEAKVGDSVNLAFPNSKTRRGRVGKKVSQTLDTQGNMGTVCENSQIRKLTPLECFRLQGFPDDMLKTAQNLQLKDCHLYKMAGNAVTVNVVETIAKKLWREINGT
jgi:DNA (cytosine-5)-methyltransferase 1